MKMGYSEGEAAIAMERCGEYFSLPSCANNVIMFRVFHCMGTRQLLKLFFFFLVVILTNNGD